LNILKCEEPLSNVAFKFNLLRYILAALDARFGVEPDAEISMEIDPGRGLHSSTFQLNLSQF
jgi:coproporphyrinogen III oxidase-like Fe-S oxidoreductase